MNVAEIMEQRNAFSFEVFPPKTDVGMEKLCGEGGVLEKLYTLNPDYISCTYGAGGTNVGKNLEVLKKIKADGHKKQEAVSLLKQLKCREKSSRHSLINFSRSVRGFAIMNRLTLQMSYLKILLLYAITALTHMETRCSTKRKIW